GEDFEAYRLVFHDGERFEFALTMRNDGPIGVTVTGVGGGTEGTVVPFVQTHVLLADRSGEYMYDISPGHRHRFRSFSLAPGAKRLVMVRGVLEHCSSWARGSSTDLSGLPVTYRVFGVTRHTFVFLRASVTITPAACC